MLLLLKGLCQFWLGCFGNLVYYLLWNLVTIFQQMFRSKAWDNNTNCELKRIIWRRKYRTFGEAASGDFIGIWKCFTSPEYVLKPNVTLYCVEKNYAYFVECLPEVNIFNAVSYPFLYIGQFETAVNVISMPLEQFVILSDKVGDPEVNVCYIANTGRCGSTILSQALGAVPGTLLLGEPDCLTNIRTLRSTHSIGQLHYEKLLVAAIRLLCKPFKNVSRIIIKTRNCGVSHIQFVNQHFPGILIIFGYRNSLRTVLSFYKVMLSVSDNRVSMYFKDSDLLSACFPWFRERMFNIFCRSQECLPALETARDMNIIQQLTYAWANCVQHAVNFQNTGGKLIPVSYEDLVEDKIKTLKYLFKEMDIDNCFMGNAFEAFNFDSQAGSAMGRDRINSKKKTVISDSDIQKANMILAKYGLPELRNAFRLK